MRLLVILLVILRVAGETPSILPFTSADPDDGDRVYSAGDQITLLFAALPSYRRIQNAADAPSLTRSGVDALLSFSASLGTDYTGQWDLAFPFDELTITIVDPAGANLEQLQGYNFSARCMPNAVYLVDSDSSDSACDSGAATDISSAQSNWGRGRPALQTVTSQTSNANLLLQAGDTVRIEFDADIDRATVDSELGMTAAADGSNYVDALLQMPTAQLGSSYTATWLSDRVLEVTLTAPPTTYASLSTGDDYTIACVPGAPLYLSLGSSDTPAPSSLCCDSGAAAASCPTVTAGGSFGALPAGPTISAALADDPDDADAEQGTLSVGDVIQITFSQATAAPAPIGSGGQTRARTRPLPRASHAHLSPSCPPPHAPTSC